MNEISPIFETERLVFRIFRKDDFENLCKLDCDPEIRKYFPGGPLTQEKVKEKLDKTIEDWEKLGFSDFALIDKKTMQFIGRAGFATYESDIELGYLILKEFWGRGYATEAAEGLIKWAKNNLNVNYIIALAPSNHIASQRVLEKIGMEYYKTDIYKGKHAPQCQGLQCKIYKFLLN